MLYYTELPVIKIKNYNLSYNKVDFRWMYFEIKTTHSQNNLMVMFIVMQRCQFVSRRGLGDLPSLWCLFLSAVKTSCEGRTVFWCHINTTVAVSNIKLGLCSDATKKKKYLWVNACDLEAGQSHQTYRISGFLFSWLFHEDKPNWVNLLGICSQVVFICTPVINFVYFSGEICFET